jgi:hypothetical protein
MAEKVNITFQPAKKKFRKDNFCRGLEIGKSVQLLGCPLVILTNERSNHHQINMRCTWPISAHNSMGCGFEPGQCPKKCCTMQWSFPDTHGCETNLCLDRCSSHRSGQLQTYVGGLRLNNELPNQTNKQTKQTCVRLAFSPEATYSCYSDKILVK